MKGVIIMRQYLKTNLADVLLSALYVALCATAQILPDETAFVFLHKTEKMELVPPWAIRLVAEQEGVRYRT